MAIDPSLATVPAVLAGMGGILKLVLSEMRRQRESFEEFLGNHMAKTTEALAENTAVLTELVRVTSDVAKACDRVGRKVAAH